MLDISTSEFQFVANKKREMINYILKLRNFANMFKIVIRFSCVFSQTLNKIIGV